MDLFSFKKTFSRMTKYMNKGVSGATHLLNRIDDSALSRCELSDPDLARLINESEDQVDKNSNGIEQKHHEEFQLTFFKDVQKNCCWYAMQSI